MPDPGYCLVVAFRNGHPMRISRRKSYWAIGLALSVAVMAWGVAAIGMFERIEWASFDQRMRLFRSKVPLHPDVAILMIDEASLQAMDPLVGRYPWPRSVYADLLDYLALGGAKAVVFDVLFTETQKEPMHNAQGLGISDQRLIEATADSGIAYHAAQIFLEEVTDSNRQLLSPPLPEDFGQRFAVPNTSGIRQTGNNNYSLPFNGLYQTSKGIGTVGLDVDRDGIFRHIRLFQTYRGEVYPTLSMAPLLSLLQPQSIAVRNGVLHFGGTSVPLTDDQTYLVNMVGDVHPYSISGVFASIERMQAGDFAHLKVPPDTFKGKIVFIGASAAGLSDIKTTAVSSKTPGVVIHASAVSNILSGDFLKTVSDWVTAAIVLLFSFLTVGAVLYFGRLRSQLLVPLGLGIVYVGWSYWRFSVNHVYALVPPVASVILALLASFTYRAFTEGRDRRRVRTMLSQYVSPAMLSSVVDRYEDQLKAEIGTRERLSILFSDIRGFTSISEQLSAEQVVDLLNTHFSVMAEVIFSHAGTLDKFIGDALMAFWGAPIRTTDHADRAVRTAIEMQRRMAEVNHQLEAKHYPPIRIGVGIDTGDVVLGNIGSERKLDYTVIGDHVNLASRLEGLTAKYSCDIVISESTKQALADDLPCAMVDLVRVKGRQHPLRIYWPLALATDSASVLSSARDMAQLTEQAFAAYLRRDWEQAIAAYQQLPDIPLKGTFIARCEAYSQQPPADEWDGVFVMTSK